MQDKLAKKIPQYKNPIEYTEKRSLIDRFGANKQNLSSWVAEHYSINPYSKVLELGCGTGELWQYLGLNVPASAEVVLTDYSDEMLSESKKMMKNNFFPFSVEHQEVDINKPLPFSNDQFEVVMAHLMLYHASSMTDTVDEIYRILKPGGCFGVSTQFVDSFGEHMQLAHGIDSNISEVIDMPFTPTELVDTLKLMFKSVRQYTYINNIYWPSADIALRFTKTLITISRHNPSHEFYVEYYRKLEEVIQRKKRFHTTCKVAFFIASD